MRVYLDHAATTPLRPEVREAFVAALDTVGNPSSIHAHGQAARGLLEDGRERLARALDADAVEVVLTAGGTEAVNLGVKGLYWARAPRRRILMSAAEHHATLDSVSWLERHQGAVVEIVPVDGVGRMRVDVLEAALAADPDETALVTALWANSEVGTVQPVRDIVAAAAAYGVPVHLDAIGALGQIPIGLRSSGAAAVSVSAHKIGGPVGAGALLAARSTSLEPLLHGGGQQRFRSGTSDAAAAAAFGLAAELAVAELPDHAARVGELRDRLVARILDRVPGAALRGDPDPAGRLPGSAHLTFDGCDGDALLMLLDAAGFSVSTGSACQAGVPEPSHVLLAMGLDPAAARGALRFSLGRTTTADDVTALLRVLPDIVARARRASA